MVAIADRAVRPQANTLEIAGVELLSLPVEHDSRGALVELCRNRWVQPNEPIQWNAITNRPRALRGIHWHNHHVDYIAPVYGRILAALVDLRIGSPAEGKAVVVELLANPAMAVVIPEGVGHGFFSLEQSVVMYGVSAYWDPSDEFGVRWDDPDLAIPWPPQTREAIVSGRDEGFGPLAAAGSRPAWVL